MDDEEAVAALVSDLQWQIEQLPRRGIRDRAGNPYNPTYYKRALTKAINTGGIAVPDLVRKYVYGPASEGYKKLEAADSLDLACEALVADETKPYAQLFSDDDRKKAQARLAPFLEAIAERKRQSNERIEQHVTTLPDDLDELRALADDTTDPEVSVAINQAIIAKDAEDVVAYIRLGRAEEERGNDEAAQRAFSTALEHQPGNPIAKRRLDEVVRRLRVRESR